MNAFILIILLFGCKEKNFIKYKLYIVTIKNRIVHFHSFKSIYKNPCTSGVEILLGILLFL